MESYVIPEFYESDLDCIRVAKHFDIPSLVALSYQKRRAYEKAQPQFWKYAGPQAEISQAKWFEELLQREDHMILIATNNEKILGFIIGKLISAPEVYNPAGLTLMIDDFCVEQESLWETIGKELINQIKATAKAKGATQILAVCGAHDAHKSTFLKGLGLTIASEWYVGEIL